MSRLGFIIFIFVSVLCLFPSFSHSAPSQSNMWMALDLGNEWLKACIINPRAPPIGLLDVVINEQSNRKTPSLIGVDNDGDRVFGEAAVALTTRNPGKVFPGLKRLIGQSMSSPATTEYLKDFAGHHNFAATSGRDSVSYSVGDDKLSVEELVSTLFRVTKKMAANHAAVQLAADDAQIAAPYDAVVTVPEYFSKSQRELVKQLASLGDVNVKLVLNDLTAAAVDYGIRVFKNDATLPNAKTSKKIIFYGAGSHGVAASLVEYSLEGSNVKVKVLAVASDESTGGLKLDRLLRDKLALRFDGLSKVKNSDASNSASIFSSKKGMAKLLREAREVKEQLSASALFQLIIEELFDGKDFTTTVTREEFEGWLKEGDSKLLKGFVKPLDDIVAKFTALGVEAASIDGVELFGGAVRVPAVQNAVKEKYPALNIGRHIDGDEAALLGAAYLANQLRTASKPDPSRPVVLVEEPESLYPASSGASSLTEEALNSIKQQLAAWESAVQERRAWDAAKNDLETYVVELKGLIESKKLIVKGGGEKLTEALYAVTNDVLDNYDARTSFTAADLAKRLADLREIVDEVKRTVAQPKEKPKVVEDDTVDEDTEKRNAEARARRKREKEKRTKQAEKDKATKAKAAEAKKAKKEDL